MTRFVVPQVHSNVGERASIVSKKARSSWFGPIPTVPLGKNLTEQIPPWVHE